MKKIFVLVLTIISCTTVLLAQNSILNFQTPDHQQQVPEGTTFTCEDLTDINIHFPKTADVMKYDMIRVDIRGIYAETVERYEPGQTVIYGQCKRFVIYKDHYKRKYGDTKEHVQHLITSNGRTDLAIAVESGFSFNAREFKQILCKHPSASRKVYAVLYGFYKVDEKYVYDDGGRMVDIYDDGEIIAKSPYIHVVLGDKEQAKRDNEAFKDEILDLKIKFKDDKSSIEHNYVTSITTPAGTFPRIKKKNLYKAYKLASTQKFQEAEQTTDLKEKKQLFSLLNQLNQKMALLYEQNTRELEKQLKGETNVETIIRVILGA